LSFVSFETLLAQRYGCGSAVSSVSDNGGFAKGSIFLGGLEVRQVTTFAKVWSTTQGSQDGLGATFFKPSPVPAGFSVFGHYAQPNNRPLFGRVLVGRDASGAGGTILAPPLDYTLVWSSPDGTGFFWLPTAPEGYKAVGAVVTSTLDKPSPYVVRCVRADFTDVCETEESVWSSDKDVFSAVTLRPAVRGVDARGVHAGTFLARSSTTPASASMLACLKNTSASYTSCMPNLAQVTAALAAYAPRVYLHPDEPTCPRPCGGSSRTARCCARRAVRSRPRRRWPRTGRTYRRAAATTARTGWICRRTGTKGRG
jgi:hypothetical protein